ncbi:MAG: GrpB family protein [Pseudomonadota bacterium]
MQHVVIMDYRSDWPEAFAQLAYRIRAAAPEALRIDHIGSTSIPGMNAKDVIDIQVSVADLRTTRVPDQLASIGFEHKSQIATDWLVGRAEDDPQLRKAFLCEPDGERRCHLHVRQEGNLNQRYALVLRDYLRAHPEAVASYEQIKRTLAARHPDDIDDYLALKDPVMDLIYGAAQIWAQQIEWQPDVDYS